MHQWWQQLALLLLWWQLQHWGKVVALAAAAVSMVTLASPWSAFCPAC